MNHFFFPLLFGQDQAIADMGQGRLVSHAWYSLEFSFYNSYAVHTLLIFQVSLYRYMLLL
jgi:hypothetical protein